MSAAANKWAWHQELPSSAKLLLLYLSARVHAGESKVVTSSAEIVRWTGLDKKTVPAAVKDLEARELITVARSPGHPSVYILNHCGEAS